MKLKFKVQPFQTAAVESVVDCFEGQPKSSGIVYRLDPGIDPDVQGNAQIDLYELEGFKNAEIRLNDEQILSNIRSVQRRHNLPLSDSLVSSAGCPINLDVEMETGTGKTYCYIKTVFEMNKRYGWTKFIVMAPSIAIREGVAKSFEITAEHFTELYGKKVRFFVYSSKALQNLESFSSDAGINVMIINIQAFNATGKDNRRIYEELDDFQSRRPIDVISANRPIIILDEPQKMEGKKTLDALAKFKPLMILRYSATHRTEHNKIHRLDALDAYNEKLVKKIAVRGISVKGLAGTNAYLYLESIEISKQAPLALIEMEVRSAGGNIKRVVKRIGKGRDLFVESNELDEYKGYVVSQIDARSNTVEFANGVVLTAGEAVGDITESVLRRMQIREAIKAHFEKESELFPRRVKVLSLFFIDEVAKYRDYSQPDEQGEYARIFQEEYERIRDDFLSRLPFEDGKYREYVNGIDAQRTHEGYFSIDKKSKKLVDPSVRARGEDAGLSDDVDAYDLILKDKERLLSFEEPVRFIFSHSALREGWDNPNVFVMCMLKHSDNTISRRQEVGRGLRLSVNQIGERMDNPQTVHDINVLTVVANESYKDFAANLQREIADSLSFRPRIADEAYFTGKVITTESGEVEVTPVLAKQIYRYLVKNDYTDEYDRITDEYHAARKEGTLLPLPSELAPYAEHVFKLIDSVFSESSLPEIEDDRKAKKNLLNENFEKKEFQELWKRMNRKAVYQVDFDSDELVRKSVVALDENLRVAPLQYTVQSGKQLDEITEEQLRGGKSIELFNSRVQTHKASVQSSVRYDLIGKLGENTRLTRKTVAEILKRIQSPVFEQFKENPEHFISEASRLINEQKATIIIERLSYDPLTERHEIDLFTAGQSREDFSKAGEKLKKHIYDYAITDSKVERGFVEELDISSEVVVYAKLPRGFFIPTPVGDYNPDWAIAFEEGSVKHVYFVAETKGTMSSMELRAVEKMKIECARKFFDRLSDTMNSKNIRYDVVDSYTKLMEIVSV